MARAIVGAGSLEQLSPVLDELNGERVFLVTGRGSYTSCGARRRLQKMLKSRVVCRFSEFSVNPDWADVRRGIERLRANPADVVVGVGGGSVLDMAKLINCLHEQTGDPMAYIRNELELSDIRTPLIAVPTTAGSGAEATHFAVIYVDGCKYSLAHPTVQPSVAIVDPSLTYGLPAAVTAVGGMDAFTQAVESYWSVRATEESKAYARDALGLMTVHLRPAVLDPSPVDRDAMSRAAHLAGRAIDMTKTTVCHALSYTLTADWGIPHGQAVAVTMPAMYEVNSRASLSDVNDARGVDYVASVFEELNAFFGCRDTGSAANYIRELVGAVGLPTTLSELGVTGARSIEKIVRGWNADRMANNPRILSRDMVRDALESLTRGKLPDTSGRSCVC